MLPHFIYLSKGSPRTLGQHQEPLLVLPHLHKRSITNQNSLVYSCLKKWGLPSWHYKLQGHLCSKTNNSHRLLTQSPQPSPPTLTSRLCSPPPSPPSWAVLIQTTAKTTTTTTAILVSPTGQQLAAFQETKALLFFGSFLLILFFFFWCTWEGENEVINVHILFCPCLGEGLDVL